MGYDFLIACVGKPSAGKSSFLNSVTSAEAKVGNYPFTTIEPNHGVAFYVIECPCKRFNKMAQCKPKYGKCVEGQRFVPVKVMDVAGLVPGAAEGKGLGNKFLDDLRHADVLIHVVDVSGTTNEKGENTVGYDPINDIDWLRHEIHCWIFNNLKKNWGGVVRRHVATKSGLAETMQLQLSGYGSRLLTVQKTLDRSEIKESLETWDDEMIHKFVDAFLDERFPTIIALNKIDMPEADKNIIRICKKYGDDKVVLTSALAEIFLKKLHAQKFVYYFEGTDIIETSEDEDRVSTVPLKTLDEKTRARLEKVRDMVLYRYGSTGTQDVVRKAVNALSVVPVYPVRNITNFTYGDSGGKGAVFQDCLLVKPGTTVREFANVLDPAIGRYYLHAEIVGGIRVGEDDIITPDKNIISFKTSQAES